MRILLATQNLIDILANDKLQPLPWYEAVLLALSIIKDHVIVLSYLFVGTVGFLLFTLWPVVLGTAVFILLKHAGRI